jgi:predicted transcriptional regulator
MWDDVSIPTFRPGPSTSPGGTSGGASVQAFKLDHTGLARLFGDLEAQIMEIIWRLEEATVGDVLARLGDDYHYNTVMTVMSRLADKEVLTRRREGRAHVYAPVEDRDAFLARVSRDVAEGLLREFGAVAIAQFVDAAGAVDPELVAELRRQVQQKSESTNK